MKTLTLFSLFAIASALLTVAQDSGTAPTVDLDPTELTFDCIHTATGCQCSHAGTVTLTNLGPTALKISRISTSRSFFSQSNSCGHTLDKGRSCAIQVVWNKVGVGPGELSVSNNAVDSPQKVSLDVYEGCKPPGGSN